MAPNRAEKEALRAGEACKRNATARKRQCIGPFKWRPGGRVQYLAPRRVQLQRTSSKIHNLALATLTGLSVRPQMRHTSGTGPLTPQTRGLVLSESCE